MSETKQGELLPKETTDVTTTEQPTAVIVKADDHGEFALSMRTDPRRVVQLSNFVRDTRREIFDLRRAGETTLAGIKAGAFRRALRQAFTGDLIADIRELEDSPLGYETDRKAGTKRWKNGQQVDVQPYDDQTVADVVIDALQSGLQPVDKEFGIISGNLYVKKVGFMALLRRECPDVTDFDYDVGQPEIDRSNEQKSTGGKSRCTARSACWASWKQNGVPQRREWKQEESGDFRLAKKFYPDTDTEEKIKGQLERLVFAYVYKRVTGFDMTITDAKPEADETEGVTVEVQPVDMKAEMDKIHTFCDNNFPSMTTQKAVNETRDAFLDKIHERSDLTEEQRLACCAEVNRLADAAVEDLRAKRNTK